MFTKRYEVEYRVKVKVAAKNMTDADAIAKELIHKSVWVDLKFINIEKV